MWVCRPLIWILVHVAHIRRSHGWSAHRLVRPRRRRVTRRLRRQDLKVVYMTGYHIPGAENEALGPILRKPVDEAALISEIERVMAE